MKRISVILLTTSLVAAAGGGAWAACPDTTASISEGKTAAISKDGTHAPLGGTSGTTTSAAAATAPSTDTTATTGTVPAKPEDGNAIAKDGGDMPLGGKAGNTLATSPQDVEAQQNGDKTAAAEGEANGQAGASAAMKECQD